MTVIEDLAPPPNVEIRPRAVSRRERWQLRLPLLPALIYTIVVTQIPFLVTLWYSFQSYFWNTTAPAHFNGLSNYKTVFTNPAFRSALVRSVIMTTNLPFYLFQQVNNAFDIGGAAATGVVTVILTIIVATFALRMFARVFQFEEGGV